MKLYLLRHAEAAEGTPDAERPLTRKGILQSRAIGQFLEARQTKLDAVFTSPLLRAVETAELVVEELSTHKKALKLQKNDRLLNETTPRQFEAWLKELASYDKVLMVGHNPSLSEHLAHLLGVRSVAAVSLPKGALAVVRLENSAAVLKLFLTPKQTGFLSDKD